LIALDPRIILTTNFDKLIDMCWISKLGSSTHFPRIFTEISGDLFSILKDHSIRFLVKIHGSVDSPDSLIFSRSEYIRLAFGSVAYSSFLETLLLNYTFLFVGFSMDDPAVCSLMEMYALRYQKARPHYMFAPIGTPENILDINKRLRKLRILPYDASHNHRELPRHITELSKEVARRRRELLTDLLSST
jgi:hypothetical protein